MQAQTATSPQGRSVRTWRQCEALVLGENGTEKRCEIATPLTGPYCPTHTAEFEGVRVAPSNVPGAGLGLFAVRNFAKGESISQYDGELLTPEEFDERYPRDECVEYAMKIHDENGEIVYIDARETTSGNARYANDARGTWRRPNATLTDDFDPRMRLIASRRIRAGQEILTEYGDEYWGVHNAEAETPTSTPTRTNKR